MRGLRVLPWGTKKLWLMVALAIAAVPLAVQFNARLAVSRQIFEEESRLNREIGIEKERLAFLQSYEASVQSDAYVEWWARVKARMVKPGEVAVVPLTPADTARSAPASQVPSPRRDYPSEWWAAFFAGVP